MTAVEPYRPPDTSQDPTGMPVKVEIGVLEASTPNALLKSATGIAEPLAKMIEDRKLYTDIKGKKYVRCEGWTTLAAMLGCTPHEVDVEDRTGDGDYVATVEFRRLIDGAPIARASAECGNDERTWKNRDRYARRSMALTRATGKAARLAFSWVMVLAGYEATPSEEMTPEDDPPSQKQVEFFRTLLKSSEITAEEQERGEAYLRSSECTKHSISDKIDRLQELIARREESPGA